MEGKAHVTLMPVQGGGPGRKWEVMSEEFCVEYVNLQRERSIEETRLFFERFDLGFDADVAFAVAARDLDETLVGTGSCRP